MNSIVMNSFFIFYLTFTFILSGMLSYCYRCLLVIIYHCYVMHCIVFKKYFFKLIYDLFEKERGTCAEIPLDGTKNGSNGEITSPGYPRNYPDNINYTWILRTGHLNANVTFTILDSDISEPYFPPCDDYLQVRKTISPCQNPLYTKYGHHNPTNVM